MVRKESEEESMNVTKEKERQYTVGCITSSVSYEGGWGTLSKGIIGAIAKKQPVVVLTSRGAQNDSVPYSIHRVLPNHHTSYSLLVQFQVFFATLRYLRSCDVIHVFIEPFAPGAALAAKCLRKPLVITLAGTYCVVPKGRHFRERVKRMLMKFMYQQATFIATGSHKNIELIEEVVPLKNKWKFVPFGVDLDRYHKNREYSKPSLPFLLTIGSVKPRKGALYTIRALGLLKDEFPDLIYKIGGSYIETPYVQELRNEIKKLGLVGRVELLGRVNDEQLLELYSTCTAFVLAAQTVDGAFEGFPMVFYEAHALGAPVISTYGFGSEYVIKNGHNGFLVPQNDYVDLAEAIKKIVGDSILRTRMSENALAEAKKHSWDDISTHYLEVYNSII